MAEAASLTAQQDGFMQQALAMVPRPLDTRPQPPRLPALAPKLPLDTPHCAVLPGGRGAGGGGGAGGLRARGGRRGRSHRPELRQ